VVEVEDAAASADPEAARAGRAWRTHDDVREIQANYDRITEATYGTDPEPPDLADFLARAGRGRAWFDRTTLALLSALRSDAQQRCAALP
jgi:hypothetical protein